MSGRSISEAWSEVEAALPQGWRFDGVFTDVYRSGDSHYRWCAVAVGGDGDVQGRGPTPIGALDTLADALRAR